MTERQISLVQKTWGLFRKMDPDIIGDVFYSRLFLEMPAVRRLFKTPRHEQNKRLIEMLTVIVGRLNRLHELTTDIQQLALRHVGYGVKRMHYEVVGSALLWTIEQGLGNDWTPEVREAWTKCYATVADTMIKASGYPSETLN